MATHDYIIANGTGAAVRADLNNALAAIVSNNSNSSAPSTTYAYQFWADTGNNVLKIRNSANDAFIELFQLDGTLTLEDGSASTPALAFRDDLNTGIFSSAADKFNVATGGVERMELGTETIFNDGGTDVDFRIEGNSDTDLFFVDASVDLIGIGNNSPKVKLDVARLGAAWTGDTPIAGTGMMVHNGNNSSGSPAYISILAGSTSISGMIFGDESNSDAGKIFYEHTDDVMRFNVNVDERMRIDRSGNVGIGISAAVSAKLEVRDSASKGIISRCTSTQNSDVNTAFKVKNNSDTDTFTISYRGKVISSGSVTCTSLTETSDIALKENIQPLANVLHKVKQLTGYKYNLKSTETASMGVIAQDVEKVFPELVHGEEGKKSLQYSGLVGALIEAVKELSAKVAVLEAA